jgi:hypothetical protein
VSVSNVHLSTETQWVYVIGSIMSSSSFIHNYCFRFLIARHKAHLLILHVVPASSHITFHKHLYSLSAVPSFSLMSLNRAPSIMSLTF